MKYDKSQLQEDAERLRVAHKAKNVFATEDGQYFLEKHIAVSHNSFLKSQDNEWDGNVITFGNDEPAAADEHKISQKSASPKASKPAKDKAEKPEAKKQEQKNEEPKEDGNDEQKEVGKADNESKESAGSEDKK